MTFFITHSASSQTSLLSSLARIALTDGRMFVSIIASKFYQREAKQNVHKRPQCTCTSNNRYDYTLIIKRSFILKKKIAFQSLFLFTSGAGTLGGDNIFFFFFFLGGGGRHCLCKLCSMACPTKALFAQCSGATALYDMQPSVVLIHIL